MSDTVRVAAVQIEARDLEDAPATLDELLRLVDQAVDAGAQMIVTPECGYPAYFIGLRNAETVDAREALAPLAERARRGRCTIVAGLALRDHEGVLRNAAVCIGPDGEELGRTGKSFLWHFDWLWFRAASEFPVWHTPIGPVGALVCADGRQPEVARMLALRGARILADCTAWVAWGATSEALDSAHCQYFMPVRAQENGCWVVAADKWGVERDSIVYAGRSTVIDPDGNTVSCLGPTGSGVLVADIDVARATGPRLRRRPELYGLLTEPTSRLPVLRGLGAPEVLRAPDRRAAAAAGMWTDHARLAHLWEALRDAACALAVLPVAADGEATLAAARRLTAQGGGEIVVAGAPAGGPTWTALVRHGEVALRREDSHAASASGPLPEVVQTGLGRSALLVGDELFVPEVARHAALSGAEVLCWSGLRAPADLKRWARARADENRVWVIAASPDEALIVSPASAVVARSLRGRTMAASAQVWRALAHHKEMAPGTDVVLSRIPEAYGLMCRVQAVAGAAG